MFEGLSNRLEGVFNTLRGRGKLSEADVNIHGHSLGDHNGQQTWECLAVLVALKTWFHAWSSKRCELRVKSDNFAALAMGAKMKVKASPLIANELALVYSHAAHEPRVFEHIPRGHESHGRCFESPMRPERGAAAAATACTRSQGSYFDKRR